ncbi:hypothetical protein [Deinococcus marmoris]|uniref:Sigma-fimbriae usher protein n=1 Tax=Deinococcus marmoris TaxID=249408 RepID=A0A1U7P0D3_9DEIO|nr:hypothetical protein [Deinococcus marmoris]OLV18633.1 hypothetical protein BOO71_0005233 [Deinococcus marmoris]
MLGLWLGLFSLGASPALAQGAPVGVAELCAAPEDLADVRVQGVSRGIYSLRRVGTAEAGTVETGAADTGSVWVQQGALQRGEERYGLETLSCDDVAFTRLNPALTPRYDPEAQTLSFEPQLGLLPTSVLPVSMPAAVEATSLPVYGLDYGLDLHLATQRDGTRGVDQNGSLNATYANGRFSAQVGVSESNTQTQALAVEPSFSARYQLRPQSSVEAGWNIAPLLTDGSERFSGVQTQLVGPNLRFLDVFTVDLPVPAKVRLIAGPLLLGEWTLGAGRVQFTGVPLPGPSGTVRAVIEDAAGRREVGVNYSFPAAVLPSGGYRAVAEAGLLGDAAYANGRVSYGLTNALTLNTQFGVKAGRSSAALSLTAASETQAFTVGVLHNLSDFTDAATLNYRGRVGGIGLGVGAVIPFQDVRQARVEAAAGTKLGGLATGLAVGYDLRQEGWYGRAQVTGELTPQVRLSVGGQISGRSRQLSLTLGYQPSAQWNAQIATTLSPAGPGVTAAATYSPTDSQQFRVMYGAGLLSGEYRLRTFADVAVNAATNGQVGASIQGALVYANGRLYASPARTDDVTVVLETGVAGLPVFVGGMYKGRTDAGGALVFSVTASDQIDIRVDLKALPIEVSVKEASLLVAGATSRSIKVDWRGNFGRSRFVDFQFGGQETAYGTVSLGDLGEYDLDAFGTTILPASAQPLAGVLTLKDGRSCPVTIGVKDDVVNCP